MKLFHVRILLNEEGWKEVITQIEVKENKATYSFKSDFWGTARFVKKSKLMQPESVSNELITDRYCHSCFCLEEDVLVAIANIKCIIEKRFNKYFEQMDKIKKFVD